MWPDGHAVAARQPLQRRDRWPGEADAGVGLEQHALAGAGLDPGEALAHLAGGQPGVRHRAAPQRRRTPHRARAGVEAAGLHQQPLTGVLLQPCPSPECDGRHPDVSRVGIGEPEYAGRAVRGAAGVAQIELLEHHGRDAPGAERPRGRRAQEAGPDDCDVHPLHGGDDSRPPPVSAGDAS